MSTLLGVVEKRSHRGPRGGFASPPVVRVRCAGCGREYVTTRWPASVGELKGCMACAPARRAQKRRTS